MLVPGAAPPVFHEALGTVVSTARVSENSDTRLVDAALRGEAGARRGLASRLLESIHREVSVTLARWSRTPQGSPDKARDLTQDVLVTLFENDARELRRWDPGRGRTLDSFVRLVARRRCARILDRDLRRHGEATSEQVVLGDDSLVERLRHRDTLRDVLRGLYAQMNARDMELFECLYVRELDPDEVAQQLKMSRGAVNAWAYRMRKQARKLASAPAAEHTREAQNA